MKTALLAGPTGLIGHQVLHLLLNHSGYQQVICLSRKPLELSHPKLQTILTDYSQFETHRDQLEADEVFCCLGTTIKKAGSQMAFREVDYEYPLAIAKLSKELGARQYLLVSSLGADPGSSVFYNLVKGEVEAAIRQLDFESFHIFQPSLLLGPRKEKRRGEDISKFIFNNFSFLIPSAYKAIDSAKVARAMVEVANQKQNGVHIHVSKELQQY